MKKVIFTLFVLFIFIFSGTGINGVEAKKISHSSSGKIPKGGGKSENGKVTFSVNSGVTYCPVGEELIENDKNRSGLPRYADVKCMVPDTNPPVIEIGTPDDLVGTCTTNAYATKIEDVCEYEWSNQDIDFSVDNIVDPGLGLKKKWYIVNGVEYPLNTFPLNLHFSEDGIYKVTIGAEDNSSHYLKDGTLSEQGNVMEYTHIFKIDKFAPILEIIPSTQYTWRNTSPILSFSIKDRYKGQNIELKSFTCAAKPENSKWVLPVSTEGEVVGSCNPNIKDCTIDNNFLPNITDCNWECTNGYTKYNGQCYVNSQTLTCDQNILPKNSFIYNKDDIIVQEGTVTKAYWNAPADIDTNGDFVAFFNNGNYTPTVGECSFDCKDGYHNENGECVNNVSIVCCKSNYPLVTVAGVKVDCTLPENATHLQCVYNNLCGGYVKDIVKEWKGNVWEYTDGILTGNNAASACGLTPIVNSNGDTCNPGYYLTGSGTSTPTCTRVPLGEWSGQENGKHACSNKPSNATYIAHTNSPFTGKTNDCPWVCNTNYNKSGGNCNPNTKTFTCSGLPTNAVWNNVGSYIQTWNGSQRTPVDSTAVYNTNGSNTSCRFECKNGFYWTGSQCYPNPKNNQSCTGLPTNAVWNTTNKIDQTWNGTSWVPSTVGSFSITPSTTQCKFKCKNGYYWDGNSCELIPINGDCGSSNGGSFNSKPNFNLCDAGNPTTVSGSGPWTWSCLGENGGSNVNCSATKN